ncbi:hypothetical protein GCM10011309_19850 [Litorimonas cladophorae]|uniref:Uncharacterized protein n=1 Tax=Litorimonas cladophorae TaxID=1220491 RepID=A0A918NH09_9PROT|nr:hypothetical protein [Litorimonas cladophorae]GGX69852.1 hypothetical protein GCM10011309_19850 [Litorimonas cladophorae]
MTLKSFKKTKRVPAAIGTLLSGVAFAGFVSGIIETPVGSNEYLHEHLTLSALQEETSWAGDVFQLPVQDRQKLATIVTKLEQPNWKPASDMALTGQALTVAEEAACLSTTKPCGVAFRLGRELSELQINKDLRVANVRETSLRVTFRSDPELAFVSIDKIANETRLLRFYQTQNGWVQSTLETLDEAILEFNERNGMFDAKFSKNFVGVNYYPASASWKDFWADFPVREIKSDLDTISDINANSVRIFLNHEYFDSEDTQTDAITKLNVFLDLCAVNEIQVLITLFDLRPDYTLSNMSDDIDHIDRVLEAVSGHSAILGIDIKNQADLDFPAWGKGVVEGWLTVMARHIQMQYPDLPVTVGWSNPNSALGLNGIVDLVTYHEYGGVDGFAERLNTIRSEVGKKPIMITELGSTIWNPLRSTRAAEAKQASRLESQLSQSSSANGVFVWTLNDFEHVGSDVVGPRPWRKAQQRQFGLIRPDGSSRPSKAVLQSHATSVAAQSIN